jgi:hypothetical protein
LPPLPPQPASDATAASPAPNTPRNTLEKRITSSSMAKAPRIRASPGPINGGPPRYIAWAPKS